MARAVQEPQYFGPIVTTVGVRAFEAHLAAGNVLPGDLLDEVGNIAGVPPVVRWVALQAPPPTGQPGIITVAARNCELNDAYIRYRTFNRADTNEFLRQHRMIVRPGMHADSVPAAFADDDPAAATAALPIPVEPGPLIGAAQQMWAVMLTFRSWWVAFVMRWGRR